MKICHFVASKGIGRGEFYVDLVNELSQYETLYLLIPKNSKYLTRIKSGVHILEYSSKNSRNNPFLYLELFKIFKNNNFDIVHTHFAKSSEIFYRLNKIFKIPHVATKHNPRKGRIFNKLKYITAVSKDVANSINQNDIKIIYNGIKPIDVPKKQKNDIFTIRAIGRLDKIKGFDILIKELSKVKKDYILEIAGDGAEYNNLSKLIKELKLENRVKLLGFRKDIPELVSTSDLIIISSLSEGFSLIALETLFYGSLLISTKVGICKEVLSDNLLVDKFNISHKVNDIIKNYEVYVKEFEEHKSQHKNQFLLSRIAQKYLNYYKEVIGIENSNH